MKKIALLFSIVAFAGNVIAQTADEVINKFIEASGGKEKLAGIKTLQFKQVIKLNSPMGQMEIPMEFFKQKGKFLRVQSTIAFGPESMSFFTLVNDTAGYIMMPANPFMGNEGGLQKMDEKDRSSAIAQSDAAGYFPEFVDYKAKGAKVELLGTDKVKGQDAYKLKVTQSNGIEQTYFISKATNLIVRSDAKGAAAANLSGMSNMGSLGSMGGRVEKMEVSVLYSDYKDVDGIKFPTKLLIKGPMGDTEANIINIKINQEINPKLFKAE